MNAPQNPQNWPQQPQQPNFGNPQQPGPQQPGPQQGHGQAGPQQAGPQQGHGQYGPPQPGFQQPGGYGPPQPPKKKRTGLVVGVVIAVIVLVVGGVFGKFYLDYTDEPGGGPGAEPIARCELSAELKSQAHVSSFRLIQAPHDSEKGMKQSHCAWEQTKGEDGPNPRRLSFLVYDFTAFSAKDDLNLSEAESNYGSFTSYAAGHQGKTLDNLGDEAMITIPSSPTDLTEVNLVVRKGPVVWNIRYAGRDKGFFTDSDFPIADAEAVAVKTAEELTSE